MHIPSAPRNATTPMNLRMTHFAFLFAPVVYLIMIWTLGRAGQLPPVQPSPLVGPFYLIAVMMGFLGFVLPSRLAATKPAPHDNRQTYLKKRLTGLIVTDALFEVAAVLGLVGRLLGFAPQASFVLILAALLLMSAQTPRIGGWIDEARQRA